MSNEFAHLPKQLRDQLAAAEQLQLEMNGTAANGNTAPVDGTPAPSEPATVPEATAVPVPPAPDSPPPPQEDDAQRRIADLEHKFQVLQGKYNAELPRMGARIKELETENSTLRTQASDAQTQAAKAATEAERLKRLIPKEAADEFGEGLLTTTAKITQQVVDEAVAPLRKELAANRQEAFYADLDRVAPNWRDINKVGTGFYEWLGESDPLTGFPRQAMLNDAVANMDVPRVAAFVKAFTAGKPSAPGATAAHAVQQGNLSRQVAPSKSGAATPPAPTPRTYTPEEYRKLTDKLVAGGFSPAEAAKLQAELDNAFNEGRVRFNHTQ